MLDVLQFVFSSVWTFIGTVILLTLIGRAVLVFGIAAIAVIKS